MGRRITKGILQPVLSEAGVLDAALAVPLDAGPSDSPASSGALQHRNIEAPSTVRTVDVALRSGTASQFPARRPTLSRTRDQLVPARA